MFRACTALASATITALLLPLSGDGTPALAAIHSGLTALPETPAVSSAANDIWNTLVAVAARIHVEIHKWIVDGYQRSPAIMIGLAGLLLLPPLAILGLILNRDPRPEHDPAVALVPPRVQPDHAWLMSDPDEPALDLPATALDRDLVQIGRLEDNDICLSDATVHRYHAVIERSPELGFVITDMSGPEGNGVRVNGKRSGRTSLADGDVVELGKVRLRFATGLSTGQQRMSDAHDLS